MDLDKIRDAFTAHGFAFTCFDTGAAARAYLAQECAGKTVSLGGSMTLEAIGAFEALEEAGCTTQWHWKNGGKCVQACDIYLTSANGLSETGEIVNLDGAGNRVSATIYGPQQCFTVCGINKLAPTLAAAVERTRKVAAPKNAQRLGVRTPCVVDGQCHDCNSPARICRALTILFCPPIGFTRHEVVLIGEELGF